MKDVAKRIGLVLLAVGVLFYVGYQVFQLMYSNIKVVTVESYSVYETVDVQVIAIRRELPVQAEVGASYLFYTLKNGSRVAKGGVIAQLYADEQTASLYQQIARLDEDIAQLESIEELAKHNYTSLEAINQQIDTLTGNVCSGALSGKVGDLRSMHSQLLTLMNKRQVVIGSSAGFSDRLQLLLQEKGRLLAQLPDHVGTVNAPASGYFIDKVDGFEEYFPKEEAEIAALTTEAVEAALKAKPSAAADAVGKLAETFTWYLACVVEGNQVSALKVGETLQIQLPFVTGDTIRTTVLGLNRDSAGKTALILKCSEMSEELASVRIQPAQLLLKEYTGLRLPDKALRFNEKNQSGAYVRMGTTVTFKLVDVVYHNEKDGYCICRIPQPGEENAGNYVKLYDDVVVEGKNLYDGKVARS